MNRMPTQVLDTARRAYLAAQGECPHWDYDTDPTDTHSESYGSCCRVLLATQERYRRALARVKRGK